MPSATLSLVGNTATCIAINVILIPRNERRIDCLFSDGLLLVNRRDQRCNYYRPSYELKNYDKRAQLKLVRATVDLW